VAIYFFDSSSLVKRYVSERGSAWVNGILDPLVGHAIHLARTTGVEAIAAISRRERRGALSAANAVNLIAQFRREFVHNFQIIEITPGLLADAMDLAEVHALRGYDAVQLAAALFLAARQTAGRQPPPVVVSADLALNTAALAEGLAVDDPNNHP
jgi:predicted nucleic acid-binding protein